VSLIKLSHNELAEDLARHLRGNTGRMVWTDTQLGPAGSPRPDVYSVDKSFSNFKADAYEIKVSVSDFRRDITSGKWQTYRPFAHRVWFAFERGLVPISEVPRECGVILRGEGGAWRAARKPTAQVLENLPMHCWMKLLLESNPDPVLQIAPRRGDTWALQQKARKAFGDEVADLLANRDSARHRIQHETDELERQAVVLRERAAAERRVWDQERARQLATLDADQQELAEALGLSRDCSMRDLISALKNFSLRVVDSGALDRAIRDLQALQVLVGKVAGTGETVPA